jgi:glucosamine--fructose-6-phosphate aminotransferase (isomerizing)
VIGVTNSADSPLASKADCAILTSAGAEFSVSCKTSVTALAGLIWLGETLTGASVDAVRPALEQALTAVEGYLNQWEAHLSALSDMLGGIQQLTLVGRGPSLAAVGTGALTIKEAAHFSAEGMSSAAFRHGPMEAISPDRFVLVYLGGAPTADLNKHLWSDILAEGGKAALVGTQAAPGALYLPPVPALVYPIVEALPAQMTSLALAHLTGREAGRFVVSQKVITEE